LLLFINLVSDNSNSYQTDSQNSFSGITISQ